MINVSDRIKNIVNVIENNTLVDVGTDHGFISILAVQSGKVNSVIACDLNVEPLKSCEKNIEKYFLKDSIKTVLSNGIENVECDYKTVTICGMGGLLVCNILKKDIEKTKKFEQLVLQPQSDYKEVREIIYKLGFYIKEEVYFVDNLSKKNTLDKYYIIFNCHKGNKPYPNEKELMFGININKDSMDIYKEYIEKTYKKSKTIYNSLNSNAKTTVEEKKEYYLKVIKYCEVILDEIK